MAKTQPAVKAKTQPAEVGDIPQGTSGRIALAAVAEILSSGGSVSGYTLIPARKAKGNHTVEDTSFRTADGQALVKVK